MEPHGLRGQRFQAAGGQRVACRDGGPTAGAAPGLQEPLGAQRFVSGGDGGAADAEGRGQLTLGGQARGDRYPAFQYEEADAVGEAAVRGQPAAGSRELGIARVLRLEQPGKLGRTHR